MHIYFRIIWWLEIFHKFQFSFNYVRQIYLAFSINRCYYLSILLLKKNSIFVRLTSTYRYIRRIAVRFHDDKYNCRMRFYINKIRVYFVPKKKCIEVYNNGNNKLLKTPEDVYYKYIYIYNEAQLLSPPIQVTLTDRTESFSRKTCASGPRNWRKLIFHTFQGAE